MANKNKQWLRNFAYGILGLTPLLSLAESMNISYVVRPDENLYLISQQHISSPHTWADLARNNNIADPYLLQIGQRLHIPVAWLAAKPAAAKLTQFSGVVQIAGLTTTWQAANKDALLQTGHRIKLGHNSSATLRFADDSELVLQPDTELALDTVSLYAGGRMTDTRLRLQSGRVEVRANPKGLPHHKLDVITPSAITAVRGTEFMVETQDDQSITQTTEGKVELLNAKGSTLVPAGYGSQVKIGQAPIEPTVTPPSPTLLQATSRFTDFPIHFAAEPKNGATGWVTQAGPSNDRQMVTISKQIKTPSPYFELGPLGNGTFKLRTWYIDSQGMPSNITQHTFEIQIPRKLQHPPLVIQPKWVTKDLQLQLPPPPDGQRYLLQLTQDAQGQQTLWYAFNAAPEITLPEQGQIQESPYHLWIWVY